MRARMRGPSLAGSIPSTLSVPALSGLIHEIIRMVEVLPAPLGPRKPNDSPLAMLKSTPSTATKSPKRLTSPCASTMGDVVAAACDAPVPVGSESGASVIGEECDVIVRERYRAAPGRYATGRAGRWLGMDWGGSSRRGSHGARRRRPTRSRVGTRTTTGGPSSTPRARAAQSLPVTVVTRGTAGRRTRTWWPGSGSTTTASRWSGAGSSRPRVSSRVLHWRTTDASASGCASAASTPW